MDLCTPIQDFNKNIMTKEIKHLVDKLILPTHYTYISRYILETTENETLELLNELKIKGVIKEHSFKGYYVAT